MEGISMHRRVRAVAQAEATVGPGAERPEALVLVDRGAVPLYIYIYTYIDR